MTVPNQPAAQYAQCIVKLNTPLRVNVVSSNDGGPVMQIPFEKIRRFGCQIVLASDIIWFETCNCKGDMEEFQFFIVALGIEKAYQIVLEYKKMMALALRQHMIMEEGDQSQYLYSYIVKSHYGHSDYPNVGRERILQSAIMSLSTSGGALSLSDVNRFARSRPSMPSVQVGPVPGDVGGRKLSDATLLNPLPGRRSPSPSPSPTSPQSSRMTLDQLQKSPRSSRSGSRSGFQSSESSGAAEFDSGVNFDEPDLSRFSAPAYSTAGSGGPALPPKPLDRMGRSFDEGRSPHGSPRTLHDLKGSHAKTVLEGRGNKNKVSLAEIQQRDLYNQKHRRGTDSADSLLGTTDSDLKKRSHGGKTTPYDHLSPARSPYDHLAEKLGGVSLHHSAGPYTNGRRKHNDAYADY